MSKPILNKENNLTWRKTDNPSPTTEGGPILARWVTLPSHVFVTPLHYLFFGNFRLYRELESMTELDRRTDSIHTYKHTYMHAYGGGGGKKKMDIKPSKYFK
jgi:hypothetical protein